MKSIRFCGSSTIGPKGQIVIPARLRKEMKIKSGDQFIVLQNQQLEGIVLVKASQLAAMMKDLNNKFTKLSNKLKK